MLFQRPTSALALALTLSAVASAKPQANLVQMRSSVRQENLTSTVVGVPDMTEEVTVAVGLMPSDIAGLKAFTDAVSDPKSPEYHHFLTPEQVAERFGASTTDVNSVVAFLKSEGLQVSLVSRQHTVVLATGTLGQFEKAFHTQVKSLVGTDSHGTLISYRSNVTPLQIPSTISNAVLSVSGIDNFARPHARDTTLTPALARGLYNTAPSYANGVTGAGCNIGYSNWDGYKTSNAVSFINYFGLPTPSGGAGSNINIVLCGITTSNNNKTGAAEGDLDMQMEVSAAPLANIYIYDGSTSSGNPVTTNTIEANNNTCDIISESYGWSGISGTSAATLMVIHQTMTAQGQTYCCASGDSGVTDLAQDPWPDVCPEILNVGGSDATTNATTGARVTEVAWNGSGGGWSTATFAGTASNGTVVPNYNVLPSWQKGTTVPTNINYRLVPDIALQAYASQEGTDTAFYFWYRGSLSAVAGTSCASPWFASGLATLEQRLAANGQTRRFGRINDLIYSENGNSSIWYDITGSDGSGGTLPNGNAQLATTGWDFQTGWGAPNFDAWYTSLASQPIAPTGYTAYRGVVTGGNLASLTAYDQNYLTVELGPTLNSTEKPVQIIVTGTSGVASASAASLTITVGGYSVAGISQVVEVYNYSTSSYTTLSSASASTTDSKTTYTISNPSQYISSTGAVQARVSYYQSGPTLSYPWFAYIDQVTWTVTP